MLSLVPSPPHLPLQDVVKQRLQVQKTNLHALAAEAVKYKGSLHCIKTIIKEEGFLALWTVRAAASHRP